MKLKILALFAILFATPRAYANIDIQFDFSYDTQHFFNSNSTALSALNAAASVFETRFTDSLSAITSGGGNDFSTEFFNPADPYISPITLSNQSIGANVIRVYVGGADLGGSTLGVGGPGGYSCSGFGGFCGASNLDRGQGATSGANAVDFAPWGGSLSFDNNVSTNWNFSAAQGPSSGQSDFYSVAVHELGHLLGFGTAASFDALVNSGGNFTGMHAEAAYGGSPVPLYTDKAHWAEGTLSTVNGTPQEAAMDPTLTIGQRKYFTELDYAAMKDIGWQVSAVPEAETWVMMLSALGLLALAARRRAGRVVYWRHTSRHWPSPRR